MSTTLGLLINMAEQDKACQPVLAGLALPHGKRMVPLLCRLMQVICSLKLSPSSSELDLT